MSSLARDDTIIETVAARDVSLFCAPTTHCARGTTGVSGQSGVSRPGNAVSCVERHESHHTDVPLPVSFGDTPAMPPNTSVGVVDSVGGERGETHDDDVQWPAFSAKTVDIVGNTICSNDADI